MVSKRVNLSIKEVLMEERIMALTKKGIQKKQVIPLRKNINTFNKIQIMKFILIVQNHQMNGIMLMNNLMIHQVDLEEKT